MRYTKEELYNMPVSRLVDMILEYQKTDCGKVFVTPEQFDAFFKVRGLKTPISDVLQLEDICKETRGKKRKED